jgi:hypothetical protein
MNEGEMEYISSLNTFLPFSSLNNQDDAPTLGKRLIPNLTIVGRLVDAQVQK